ncbi:hypothetical protein [Muricoccus radiodurans]|uniref:hypothetical protein n=1 Tax=Muricoccus radiodurans TaxID=2231721 RepID=UPI003CE7DD71
MRRRLPLLLLLPFLLPSVPFLPLSAPARAMEFATETDGDTTLIIGLGEIRLGDEGRFANLLGRLGQRIVLVLDSPGGNVWAANSMRGSVAGHGMTVLVPSGADCASACFLLFAAARDRVVGRGARIGVHSVSRGRGVENTETRAATTEFARLANNYEVPPAIVARIVTTRPSEMAWLSEADILSIRNTRIVDTPPVNVPARPAMPEPATPAATPVPGPAAGGTVSSGPAPVALPSPPAKPSGTGGAFAQGRADWAVTQDWVQGQSGSLRAGIESWVRRRSMRNPGGCENLDPDFARGCAEARRRFAPIDARRMTDPEYRRGFSPG